jgi:pyruvate dehydrogenase E2 component (dihydrolipoamide acetyltransferase)
MAETVLLPRQGNTVESCVILSWKKEVGESVSEGEVLCEVETDKATFEVESTASGVLLARFFEEGDDVPVLTALAAVGETGEDVSALAPASSSGATTVTQTELATGQATVTVGKADGGVAAATTVDSTAVAGASTVRADGKIAISPRARRLAAKTGLDPVILAGGGSGPGGRIIERDVQAAIDSGQPLTPAAQAARLASGAIAPAVGTGIGGRIRSGDLIAAEAGGTAADTTAGYATQEFPGVFEDVQVSGVRKIIAERMHASLRDTAQLTLHSSADASSIMRYRKLLKASPVDDGLRSITINDIALFAAVRTITEFPDLNAHFLDTYIRKYDHVHAGFAVDTERGLMVPVIRYADTLSLRELSAEANRLALACQGGSITPDELSDGTFTVSNLGALGVQMFTPVLNPPQVSILGVCSIEQKPVQGESGIELVPHIGLSLTFDHRSVDGSPAAWFLKRLAERIASFDLVLAG